MKKFAAAAAAIALTGCSITDKPAATLAPLTTTPTTTTTTSTTMPATTTTSPTFEGVDFAALAGMQREHMRSVYGQCGEWHDTAIAAGWPEDAWPIVQRIMWRESRCTADAFNGSDAGLAQINRVHTERAAKHGWSWPDDMFDANHNLTIALELFNEQGCNPWAWLDC